MKPSELKRLIEQQGIDRYFFTRETMRFFGDTMANYGVRSATIKVRDGSTVDAWELYRKHPVRDGHQESAYFDKAEQKRLFPVKD